jgi:hypothetical protein
MGRFVTVAIDTEVGQANTKALYSTLETALTHLDVTSFNPFTILSQFGSDFSSHIGAC